MASRFADQTRKREIDRLWPVLAGTDAWIWIVGLAGLISFVLGAYMAIFQHDVKGLLAYSTVSHLGLITLLLGLNSSLAARYGDRWNDATALEAAFMHGLTRFPDSGRGQGLQQIRRNVGRWGGKISIRSGSARIADVPDWDEAPPLEERLPMFPGSQIAIVLPAREPQEPAKSTASSATARRGARR